MKTKYILYLITIFILYYGQIIAQTRTLDTTLPVGTTPGSACVSQTGAATYFIPIFVSPGTNGMQPNLAITYNSLTDEGLLGKGWDISGISAITRIPVNFYNEGWRDPVDFDMNDRFAIDGQQLLATTGIYGADSTKYHTELESFINVIGYSKPGSGPEWFKAETKNGIKMEFGNTPDSRIEDTRYESANHWYVSRITDKNGNYISYTYDENRSIGESHISKIEYTGRGDSLPYNSINFFYQNANYEHVIFIGSRLHRSKLINKITIVNENKQVREYNFNYTTLGGESRLSEIIEKGYNGEQLNSTLIDWPLPTAQFAQEYTFPLHQSNEILYGDYNGDGKSDLFVVKKKYSDYTTTDKWKLYLNSNGSFTLKDSGFLPDKWLPKLSKVGDINGDGNDDIVLCNKPSSSWFYTPYLSNGTNSLIIQASDKITCNADNDINIGDFDGDGLQDMIIMKNNHIANGYEWFIYSYTYSNGLLVPYNGTPKKQGIIRDFNNHPIIADFNGSGKTDLIYLNHDSVKIYEMNGSSFSLIASDNDYPSSYRYFPGDFNGDGRSDLLYYKPDKKDWHIELSQWNRYTVSVLVPLKNSDPFASTEDDNYFIKDFNGDGRDDILEVYTNWNGSTASTSTFNIYYNTGSWWFSKETYINNDPSVNDIYFGFGDFNGDRKQDIFYRSMYLNPYTIFSMHKNEMSQFVSSITNGLNHVTQFSYKTLSSGGTTYTKSTGATFPVIDFQGPLYVVDNISEQNGIGSINTTYYQYTGAKIHLQGRGFLGFNKVTSYNNETGLKQENTYAFDNVYYQTYLKQSKSLTTSGTAISETNQITSFHDYGNKRYFPFVSSTIGYDRIAGITTTSSANYDVNGNLISTTSSNGTASKTISYRSYNNFGSPGFVTTTNSRTGESDFVAKDSFQYYNNGLIKQKITEPGDTNQVYTDYTYNNYGNLTQVKTSPDGGKGRYTKYEYDPKGRMVIKTENAAGQFSKDSCDFALGLILQTKDFNNQITSYSYDSFGRLNQTTSPIGNTSTSTYSWITGSTPQNAIYLVTSSAPGTPISKNYYDRLGRVICSETVDLNGTKILTETSYNNKGQVEYVTFPHNEGSSNTDRTSYTYDFLGRVLTEIAPGKNLSYTYTGLTSKVTDNNLGQTHTRLYDATGLVKKATDPSGADVNYTYNAQGQAKLINTLGNNIHIEYDQFGKQTVLRDPNAGSNKYGYNRYGELISQIDTLGRTTSVIYDSIGRITSKIYPDNSFTYFYNANGLIDSIRSVNVSKIYAYDTYKRPKIITDRIKGVPLNTEYDYDTYGRISKKIFPSGFAITYNYKNGYLEEIKRADNGASIWKVTGTNTKGQITTSLAGNGLITTKTYNNKGALLTIATGLNSSVQNLEYSYYESGLMEGRTDKRHNSTYEGFYYDDLNRLATIYNSETGVNKGISYDNNGKITFKSGIGNYSYNNAASQAVKQVEYRGPVSPIRVDISYTSFNKIRTISEGTSSSSFTYGTDNERSYVESVINSTIIKKYYTENYEKIIAGSTTRELNYIFAGGQLVAIFVKNGTTDSMYYVHTDLLGSLNVITNSSGIIVNEISYDAWGNRRDPATWENYKTPPPGLITSRGFTGHEHMDAFGLINMNGRVYDPVLGVFLSPDNVVQEPEYSQSYNRYSYCLNNPLMYTDPTGYTWWSHFKGWVKEGFDNLGKWLNNNNLTLQIGYSTNGGTPFISVTSSNGLNVAAGYNTSTNSFGVGTNGGGFTDFYYPTYNYNVAENKAYQAIENVRNDYFDARNSFNVWEEGLKRYKLVTSNTLIVSDANGSNPEYQFIAPQDYGEWGQIGSDGLIHIGCMSCHDPELGAYHYAAYNSQERFRGIVIGETVFIFGSGRLTMRANVANYTFTKTAAKHFGDIVKYGEYAGKLARPYMNSPLTIQEIISTGAFTTDAYLPNAVRYAVPGTFRGSVGTWELVIDHSTNLIYHFNFVK